MAKSQYEEARAMFFRSCKNGAGAEELANGWEHLLDKPAYQKFVENWLALVDGHNPMPDLDRYESLIRSAGHEMAASEVLKSSNLFTGLFLNRVVHRESYQALHMTIAARLLPRPLTFSERDLLVLYSTMDRLLRGGPDWQSVSRVPAATGQFYRELASVSMPVLHQVTSPLNSMIEPRGRELFGERYKVVATGALSPQLVLAAATAMKNGRKTVSISEAMDAAWTYLRLFDVDLSVLPLVVREGKSGYEKTA